MSFGIALPSWIVEKENSVWVLGLYALVFMIALPTGVRFFLIEYKYYLKIKSINKIIIEILSVRLVPKYHTIFLIRTKKEEKKTADCGIPVFYNNYFILYFFR